MSTEHITRCDGCERVLDTNKDSYTEIRITTYKPINTSEIDLCEDCVGSVAAILKNPKSQSVVD